MLQQIAKCLPVIVLTKHSCRNSQLYPIKIIYYIYIYIRGSFEKFVDLRYYFESELRGGAVTVSFTKHLPWQEMHFLQRSTHFSKTCCTPSITSKFLASSELPFYGRKSPESHGGEIWTVWRMF